MSNRAIVCGSLLNKQRKGILWILRMELTTLLLNSGRLHEADKLCYKETTYSAVCLRHPNKMPSSRDDSLQDYSLGLSF